MLYHPHFFLLGFVFGEVSKLNVTFVTFCVKSFDVRCYTLKKIAVRSSPDPAKIGFSPEPVQSSPDPSSSLLLTCVNTHGAISKCEQACRLDSRIHH